MDALCMINIHIKSDEQKQSMAAPISHPPTNFATIVEGIEII